ncbi:MAG TPA: S8 family serine peptidase [Clostridium sp.]
MKKKTISRLLIIVFTLSICGYKVQAVTNNTLRNNIKNDKSGTKSKIMSIYKKNKVRKNFKQGEILVKIKSGTSNSAVESVEKKYSMKTKKHLKKQLDVVKFDSKKYSVDEVLLNLNNNPNVEYAEPNYISKLSSSPSMEPYFNKMWGLNNTTTKGIDIDVENAWKTTTGNPNLVVGIIDTGIDYNHEDLKSNIWTNTKEIAGNGIDDDNDGYIDDYNGWNFAYDTNNSYDDNSHGTHVSGIIAASANGKGIVGVAPTVKIMPLKAADDQGDLYTSDVISAIQYGISHGVKLFNCSFGCEDFSQTEYDAFKNSNALFVCAAGNGDANGNGLNNDNAIKNYPSSFDLPNIISVASMETDGTLSTFSNYGLVSVDIAAPGRDIYSTVPGGYGYKSGTSMATPYVTGVAALALSTNMNLTPIEIKNSIMKSTNKLPKLVKKISTGAIVDAFGAMAIANPSMVFSVTDVDKNGITDTKDLALVGSAYNSRPGDSKYKNILDINNDGIIDVYDLVCVSKAMK